tara:strand:- start:12835 stop:14139 length:1305 start_codon:yes stop_codon:yes gene_type:complete
MTLKFTRYLYNQDEVKLTLIENLLNQKNLKECYFWIYEYFQSNSVEDTYNLIYKIYYDFYGLKNPKFEKKINKYYKLFTKDNDIKYILVIIKNLFKFEKDSTIFLLRTYYSRNLLSLLKSKNVILDNFKFSNQNQQKLVNSISQKNKEGIAYYLKKLINDNNLIELLSKILKNKIIINDNYNKYSQLLFIIISSFKIQSKKKVFYLKIQNKEIENVLLSNYKSYNENTIMIKDENYITEWLKKAPIGFDKIFPNPKKQIEFVMKQKYKDIEEALGNLWKDKDKVKGKEYDALIFFGSILDDILLKIETPYKIFQNKRLYSISDNIGCFNLQRNEYNLNDIFWYHWEYFAYKSPIWKKRFDKYNINVNDEKQTIEFKNEDELEEFYENYGFDPDEQKLDVQEKSIKKIKNKKLSDWLNSIFKKKIKKNIRIKVNY